MVQCRQHASPADTAASSRPSQPPPTRRGFSFALERNKDQLICTLYAHLLQTQCKHNADLKHTNSKPSTCAPARSKVVETLDHGAVAVHPYQSSIAVLLVHLHPDTKEERPYEHGSVPLMPCRSCKNQSTVSKFATDDSRKLNCARCIRV